MHMRPHTA